MIAGLLPTTEGAIEVSGKPVTGPVHSSVVFQQHLLLASTILNNVLLQIEVRRLDKALRRAGKEPARRVRLGEFADASPTSLGRMNQRRDRARAHPRPRAAPDGWCWRARRHHARPDGARFPRAVAPGGQDVLFITHSVSRGPSSLSNRVIGCRRGGRIAASCRRAAARATFLIRDEPEFARHTRHIRRLFEKMGVLKERHGA
jgi:NitT/TauT family transport system ATP-binding protein